MSPDLGRGMIPVQNPHGTAARLHAWGCISSTQYGQLTAAGFSVALARLLEFLRKGAAHRLIPLSVC
jgi:hypothetical protein